MEVILCSVGQREQYPFGVLLFTEGECEVKDSQVFAVDDHLGGVLVLHQAARHQLLLVLVTCRGRYGRRDNPALFFLFCLSFSNEHKKITVEFRGE